MTVITLLFSSLFFGIFFLSCLAPRHGPRINIRYYPCFALKKISNSTRSRSFFFVSLVDKTQSLEFYFFYYFTICFLFAFFLLIIWLGCQWLSEYKPKFNELQTILSYFI